MSNNLHNLLTEDSRIFHQPDLSYETAEKVVTAIEENGKVIFKIQTNFENIMYLWVEEIMNGIFRIKAWKKNADFELTSKMFVYKETSGELELIEETDGYRVKGDKHAIVVNKYNFNISLFNKEGKLLWQTEGERIADKYLTPPLGFRHRNDREEAFLSFRLQNDERLFGLGEKFNKVEKTGTRATIWAADTCGTNTLDLSYKSIPLLFSDKGWGVMLHSSTRNFWEVGSFSYTSGSVLVEEDTLDIFLFAGEDLKDLISKYTDITGRPSPLPKWAFGVWVSKCAYESREEVESIANTM
jgi:alpha-D-xyloside xylohydrolase